MVYNMSFMDTGTSLLDLFVGVNNSSDGLLSSALLITFMVVLFISIKEYDTKVALVVSTFITSLVGSLMLFAQFIGWEVVVIIIILFLISLIMKWFGDS
jgi:hypothetical protein